MSGTRTELVQQLRQLGVEMVTAEYDGYGDSGQIEDPKFESGDVPSATVMAVQNLFYDLLEDHYGGWEINEGSCGHFEWNVKDDRITLLHTIRTEETEEQEL